MTAAPPLSELHFRIEAHLAYLYPEADTPLLADQIIEIMDFANHYHETTQLQNHWDQSDIAVITYGNTVKNSGEVPLKTLSNFLHNYLSELISIVHILPFYPFSSDDGFSVVDYSAVNAELGTWEDIQALTDKFKLMADLVINHCSAESEWFKNFLRDQSPGKDYFFTAKPDDDVAAVVRPRTSPLLNEVDTVSGKKHVWCTFSPDQVDLNFKNPEVLLEFVRIIALYLRKGVGVFRLDAIAFLWKVIGSDCLNLPETHEVVRLLRTLVEHSKPGALLITETNIPNQENLSYFGNANEAHVIYNFSLPPLLVNTLITGDCHYLRTWMMSNPPARNGTTYFNFIASHDGLGLRPAEGLLTTEEIQTLAETLAEFGGRISWRALNHGSDVSRPYEINISLYDALKGTIDGLDQYNHARFICAHAIMLALEGIPAFYFHSLFATHNDEKRLAKTGQNRSINRHRWELSALEEALSNGSEHQKAFEALSHLILIRKNNPAFHPNATQFTLHMPTSGHLNHIFAFWRQSMDREQSIFCVNNITNAPQSISLADLNLVILDEWQDLLSGESYNDHKACIELAPYQSLWLSNKVY